MSWTTPPRWLEWGWVKFLRDPYVQIRMGAVLMAACSIAWPLSWVFYGSPHHEPAFVFHLSWAALWLTGWTLMVVTDVGESVK